MVVNAPENAGRPSMPVNVLKRMPVISTGPEGSGRNRCGNDTGSRFVPMNLMDSLRSRVSCVMIHDAAACRCASDGANVPPVCKPPESSPATASESAVTLFCVSVSRVGRRLKSV